MVTLAYQLFKNLKSAGRKSFLIVTTDEKSARKIVSDLNFFTRGSIEAEVCLFPAPDQLPYTKIATQPDIWIERIKTLNKLSQNIPVVVVTSADAALRITPPKWVFSKYRWVISQGELIDREELSKWLTETGYINQPLVEDEGNFSVRGGIVDIFPPTADRPVRIELDGDEVVSIRSFDPSTQRSSFIVSSVTLIPARNVILNEETKERALSVLKELSDAADVKPTERRDLASAIEHNFYAGSLETLLPLFYKESETVIDYFDHNSEIFTDDKIEIDSAIDKLKKRCSDAFANCSNIEKIVPPEKLYKSTIPESAIQITASSEGVKPLTEVNLLGLSKGTTFKNITPENDSLRSIAQTIKSWQAMGMKVIVVAGTSTQAERIFDLIGWHGIASEITERSFSETLQLPRHTVWIMTGHLSSGLISEKENLVLLTDQDIFGEKSSKRPIQRNITEAFTDFSQLNDGDFVVHKLHGISKYLGLKNMEIAGVKNDFLTLEFLGKDKLYLPVWRIGLISRYIGNDPDNVVPDKLGGTRWTKTQEKVTAAVRTMAMELLKIYAQRKSASGSAFSGRDAMLEEFEAAFPYDETPDQLSAIEDVIKDMTEEKPTDRLICGDVGYGKTEVAMRAAFKAVSDGKQVAVLVPTTVLAFQHYENFIERFKGWPARIEMMSRFRSRTEQKHISSDVANGAIQIIIGTHRLLQKDIKFHDLGLLVIDEEHRFGVAHKEKIRKLKAVVDTITMSATPIPRTLHMSLSGIRDISIINTPPVNRLSIRTYVTEFDDDLVRAAVMAELSRGGQIFFVHNRVDSIIKMRDHLIKLIPEAKIVVGHGQMDEHELEDVMIKFIHKEANILLCTTIIESGLDIPSANTIIINRADRLGLAQLYQLRGRVGRSSIQAYAYLLTPDENTMSTVSKKRLALLQRYTELGSGFQIAMHDLEIRGAGNILGAQQSGHINSIGYEMYMDLLERAVNKLQGKPEELKIDVEIILPIEAYIPTNYVEDEGQRLVLYRRLAAINTNSQLDSIISEIEDRYGKASELVKNLFGIVEIKIAAKELAIESIIYDGKLFAFKFHPQTKLRPEIILGMIKKEPKKYGFRQPAILLINKGKIEKPSLIKELKSELSLITH